MLTVLSVVLLGSILAAIPSGGFTPLLIGRGMQGLGFALMPLNMAVIRDSLPESRSGPAIALLSVAATAGVGISFPITGVIDEVAGLNATFWFGAFVAGLALVLGWPVLPPGRQTRRRPLDVLGALLLGGALLALLVAVTEGTTWGWRSPRVLVLLAAAAALAASWVRHERVALHPLVEMQLLRRAPVVVSNLAGLLISMAMYMFLPLLTDYVQTPRSAGYGFGATVVVAGLMLVPYSVLSTSMSRVATLIGNRIGAERVLPLGALVMAAATALFAVTAGALWEAFVATGLMGVGLGFSVAVMPGLIMRAVPAEETGSALGFYQVVRFIGFALGSAVSASILAGYTRAGQMLPQRTGFEVAIGGGAATCLIAAASSAWLGRRAPTGPGRSVRAAIPVATGEIAADPALD